MCGCTRASDVPSEIAIFTNTTENRPIISATRDLVRFEDELGVCFKGDSGQSLRSPRAMRTAERSEKMCGNARATDVPSEVTIFTNTTNGEKSLPFETSCSMKTNSAPASKVNGASHKVTQKPCAPQRGPRRCAATHGRLTFPPKLPRYDFTNTLRQIISVFRDLLQYKDELGESFKGESGQALRSLKNHTHRRKGGKDVRRRTGD